MSDLISREQAIDALTPIVKNASLRNRNVYSTAKKCMRAIEDLPSAQPVITCDGCKFIGTYDTDFPCRNCIRREKDYYAQE